MKSKVEGAFCTGVSRWHWKKHDHGDGTYHMEKHLEQLYVYTVAALANSRPGETWVEVDEVWEK